MAETFYTLVTKAGQAQLANASALGSKVNFKTLKVGDGNGSYYDPTETQTDLVHTVWSGNINSVKIDENNPNWVVIESIIPSSVGDFTVREMGVFDDNNNLLAIAKVAETYKPVITDGSTKELLMNMILVITNTESINLKIDPTIVFATKSDINSLTTIVTNLVNDLNFVDAGGTANAITLTMQQLVNGYSKTFIASTNNNGSATTINNKPVYKPNTTIAPTFVKGKAYTVWYNSSKDCFFIKASAEGTAVANDVLATKTFSNDTDTGIQGGIPVNGTLNYSLPINGTYNIPSGYTSGGSVTQNLPTKSAQTYIPSNVDQIISFGQWLTGNQVLKGDSNLKAENILNGVNIFGITGNVKPSQVIKGIQPLPRWGNNTFTKVTLTYRPKALVIIRKLKYSDDIFYYSYLAYIQDFGFLYYDTNPGNHLNRGDVLLNTTSWWNSVIINDDGFTTNNGTIYNHDNGITTYDYIAIS